MIVADKVSSTRSRVLLPRVRSSLLYASEVTRFPLLDVYDDDDEAEDGR